MVIEIFVMNYENERTGKGQTVTSSRSPVLWLLFKAERKGTASRKVSSSCRGPAPTGPGIPEG